MQLESRRAVPQASQPPIIQSLKPGHFNNSTTRRPRSEKPTADFEITHNSFIFLFFDSKTGICQPICGIIIENKTFTSAKAALVCSFCARRKNCCHLGCGNVMRSRGCAMENKGITLTCLTGKWIFLRNLNNRRTVKSILLISMFFGQVEMMFELVYSSFSLPEWQALKMTFFAPWWYRPFNRLGVPQLSLA